MESSLLLPFASIWDQKSCSSPPVALKGAAKFPRTRKARFYTRRQLSQLCPFSSSQVLHRLPVRSPADGERHRGDGERRSGESCGLHPVSPVQLLHHRYQSHQHRCRRSSITAASLQAVPCVCVCVAATCACIISVVAPIFLCRQQLERHLPLLQQQRREAQNELERY